MQRHPLNAHMPERASEAGLKGPLRGLCVLLCALFVSCTTTPEAELECVAQCAERQCGDDGCGAQCGTCAADELCTLDGQCAAELPTDEPNCAQSCDDAGLQCGEHCGESCGQCTGAQQVCERGQCVCQADCRERLCDEDDGCGGSCSPCPASVSCEDCPFKLSVVETRRDSEGEIRYVVVALDFQAPVGAELPGLADLRFDYDGPGTVVSVATGAVLNVQGAQLFADPGTGHYYRVLPEGVLQLLLKPGQAQAALPSGRWLFVEFELGDDEGPARTPFSVRMVARKQTFAPVEADTILWDGDYVNPVVVWPWERNADED